MGKIIKFSLIFLITGCSVINKPHNCSLKSDGKCDKLDTLFAKEHKEIMGSSTDAYVGNPIRTGENIQQIWIGPYEDEDGNFHEPSYVYTVIKKGIWLGEPVEAIKN